MKNIKILAVSSFFYPHAGGSEQYMEDLYTELKKRYPFIQIDILCCNTDLAPAKEKYKGLTIYRIPCFNIIPDKFTLANPFSVLRFFYRRREYNLIHASTRFFELSWWSLLLGKLFLRKKVVLTDHCAGTPASSNRLISSLANIIDYSSGRLLLKFYDQVFTVSNATRLFLKNKFGINAKIFYGGPNINFLRSLNQKPLKQKKIRVVYAGRMIPEKGIWELFETASSMPQAEFFFAGQGVLAEKLQKEIRLKGLSHIHILGKLNKKELAKLFRRCHIFVYPSYHPEGIPMAILEAGAVKLCVVAANSGGIKEVIKNNETGLLIKSQDQKGLRYALEKLIKDKNLRKKLGSNLCHLIEEKFNWKKTAQAFYSEIIKHL